MWLGDTRAVQPVLIFSHKPLKNLEEVPEICKVMDVAIIPGTIFISIYFNRYKACR